ncbi:MAG: VPLPA-CTERM sorting domain-containing protein, partial [Myxococcales bacterium]|nr:VPLPA-CTERM sorting domain-containing protein [Myxococcales bacterium]
GTVSTVPEPATVLLFAGGLVGLGVVARRRKRTA